MHEITTENDNFGSCKNSYPRLEAKSEISDGKRRITITRSASGIDKTKEAVLKVMGNGYSYTDSKKKG